MPVNALELLKHIQIIGTLHTLCPKEPKNAIRIWDNQTPYMVHPIWCACTIATEQKLSPEIRRRGILVLLYHDIIEDTDGKLPSDLPPGVALGVQYMTFRNTMEEWRDIWNLPIEIRLFKLYDKTSNLLDAFEKDENRIAENKEKLLRLVADVEKHYGDLNITLLARSLLARE
jgi:hypothetical protein